jgi:phosphoglycolate phosphatase
MIKNIIFDLDGTVIDTLVDLARAISDTLVAYQLPAVTLQQARSYLGGGAKQFVAQALQNKADDSVFFDKFFASYMERYNAYQLTSQPYPGIPSLLTQLKASGCRNFIFSNKPHDSAQRLIAHVLPNLFVDVHGHKPNTKPKPDLTEYHRFAKRHHIDPNETLVIGDSTFDIFMAQALNVPSIAVTYGYMDVKDLKPLQPTMIVDRVDQLYDAIQSLSK